MRVVADTNVYISALMFGGLPGSFLDLGLLRSFTLIISPAILDELHDKLCVKFAMRPQDAGAIRAKLESVVQLVTPELVLDIVKSDPDDNRILECAATGRECAATGRECAATGRADYVVSGDRHLLDLQSFEGIPILTVRQFLDALASNL